MSGSPPRALTVHQVSKKRREKKGNKKAELAAGKRGRKRMSGRGMGWCVRNLMCDHKIKEKGCETTFAPAHVRSYRISLSSTTKPYVPTSST
jgi:hypothetical protein